MADLAPEVLHALVRLVTASPGEGFDDLSTEQILETMALVQQRKKVLGRAAAELHYGRKMEWKDIAAALGVEKSTPAAWAKDYREEFDTARQDADDAQASTAEDNPSSAGT